MRQAMQNRYKQHNISKNYLKIKYNEMLQSYKELKKANMRLCQAMEACTMYNR